MVEQFRKILLQYWGYKEFRPLQEEIIQSIYNGHDTLALMPTGGGKSITFQVPALAKSGICIVVTPLIALMKDQVEGLKKLGIRAIAIHSGMTGHEIDIAFDNAAYGDYKFLYLSPERLATDMFKARVLKMDVSMLVIDEAHCISQWGYDFRPSYLRIADVRELLSGVPALALTATATPKVIDDIVDKLHFSKKNVFKKSFERKNLIYVVRDIEDKERYLLKTIRKLNGCGIVYVRDRGKTRKIAELLQRAGITVDYYHAGLSPEMRSSKQDAWMLGSIRVIVATNAFGMGIDKSDVRFVIHIDLPDSLEAYFQEAGRAGRDGEKAYALLLYHDSDRLKAEQRFRVEYPEIEEIKRVYSAVCNYLHIPYEAGKGVAYEFNMVDFSKTHHIYSLTVYNSLKILQREGYLELTDTLDNPSKIYFLVNRDDLYKIQLNNPDIDGFIKTLLRAYSGLFNGYVAIDEAYLARITHTYPNTVYEYLKKLTRLHVINYIPRKQTPLLIFTEERLDEKNLRISKENYNHSKKRFAMRAESILHYATTKSKCRSQQLLAYFGETDSYRCGQCDVCAERNELDLSKYEFDMILEKIKEKLSLQPLTIDELIGETEDNAEKQLKVIRWLLDNSKIRHTTDSLLTWNKPL
ncbi:MAG: RecQ family ATP-dependent DNA helicase [Prevotellaceae bacterium]|jgi:ATP-dependent DNA helicase RecQ|nr:RecQ family ATP-dependent DNA helicase [Prevotellaceae bacterium]